MVDYIVSNDREITEELMERLWREWSWPNLRYILPFSYIDWVKT
jgi:hypothetical protein